MADDGSLKAGLRVLIEPIEGYLQTFGSTVSPQFLADSLSSGRMTPATLVRFMLGSVVLASVIGAVLPVADPLSLTTIPVLSELLMLLIWFVVNGALIALIHKPLMWLGRRAPLRHAVMAAMFVSAMFYPFLTLADGVWFRVTGEAFPPQAMGLAFVWVAQSLARLYGTTSAKAGGLLLGASMLAVWVSIGVAGLEIGGEPLFGPRGHTAETLTPVVRQSIADYLAKTPQWKGTRLETLSIAPTEIDNTYRGPMEITTGPFRLTWDVVVTVNGDDIRWELTGKPRPSSKQPPAPAPSSGKK